MQDNLPVLHWEDSTRNRLSRSLHGAMLSPDGYGVVMGIRPIGEKQKKFFDVRYDRDYVITWLGTKLFKPFENVSHKELESLLNEAYQKACPQANKPLELELFKPEEYAASTSEVSQ